MVSTTDSPGTRTPITITAAMVTTITTEAALARLFAWSSPAYPIGGFSFSHGIERAVEDGLVTDRDGLVAYVATVLEAGAGRIDAALFAVSWRTMQAGDDGALDAVAATALAWRGTAETALESVMQGGAFAAVTAGAWSEPRFAAFAARHGRTIAHPVAAGAAAAAHGIALATALFAHLSSVAANLVSAGVRLIPLGQTDGQVATASLIPAISTAVAQAIAADLETIGTSAPMLDLLSMRHETQYTRLFRS